jgi:hypothetical protein
MCPYIVEQGEVLWGGVSYGIGKAIPAAKGEAEDMVEVGAVAWYEPLAEKKAAEPEPMAEEKAAEPEPLSQAAAELSHHKVENKEASQAGRVLESARKPKPARKPVAKSVAKRAPKGGDDE